MGIFSNGLDSVLPAPGEGAWRPAGHPIRGGNKNAVLGDESADDVSAGVHDEKTACSCIGEANPSPSRIQGLGNAIHSWASERTMVLRKEMLAVQERCVCLSAEKSKSGARHADNCLQKGKISRNQFKIKW